MDAELEKDKEELDRLYPDGDGSAHIDPDTGEIHDPVDEKAEKTGSDPYTLRLESLQNDIFQAIMQVMRNYGGFEQLDAGAQAAVRYEVIDVARSLINGTLAVHAGQGRPAMQVLCGDVAGKSKKDVIEAKIGIAGNDPMRHMLFDARGHYVHLVFISNEGLIGGNVDERQDSLV